MAEESPPPMFHFLVEWAGARLGFAGVSGLDTEIGVAEYRDGATPESLRTKMPGMHAHGKITLKRGTFAGDFHAWWADVAATSSEPRDLTITLLDEEQQPVLAWGVKNALPIKVQSTALASGSNEVAIESLEITHEGIVIRND